MEMQNEEDTGDDGGRGVVEGLINTNIKPI